MRVLFHGVLTYVDTFLPKSGIILPQIVEISSPDVEISPPRSLFRNFINFIVNQDLIYPHRIDCHKISSIDNPRNAFNDEGTKRHGTGKISIVDKLLMELNGTYILLLVSST